MELTAKLRQWAMARPAALIINTPRTDRLRWLVEAEMDRRGWQLAASPAEADLMITLGSLNPALADAANVMWSQMPQPRHRTEVIDAGLAAQFDAAVQALTTPSAYEANQLDAASQLARAEHGAGPGGHAGQDMAGHTDHDAPVDTNDDGGHHAHDMAEDGGHDMGSGHDHHMHHGGDVAGLAMAGTAPDRDGLELDELKVALGPVLPAWPTGLLLKASMQGDVLTDVSLSWVGTIQLAHAPGDPVADALAQDAHALDALARFLLVAGWPMAARLARRARTDLTSAHTADQERGQRTAVTLARRVERSKVLAWSVRGLGATELSTTAPGIITPGAITQPGKPRSPDGNHPVYDVLDRVRRLAAIARGDAGREGNAAENNLPRIGLTELATLLEGSELAAARLIIASFVPEPKPHQPNASSAPHHGEGGTSHDHA